MTHRPRPATGNGRQEILPVVQSAGTRYIVDELIRKVSGQDQLELITSLNLTLVKDGGKIKFIENLDRLQKLETLNLSNNVIERIEKLDKLTRLRELNLSFNCIAKIEHLEALTSLQVLNLTGNRIETIPVWLARRLKSLRVFKLAKNRIQSLQEISKLRPLSNLIELTVSENPVAELPHCRHFVVFHLRTLEKLDGKSVALEERHASHVRFAQEELENLTEQLERREQEFSRLTEAHNKSLQDMEDKEKKRVTLEETAKQLRSKLKDLGRELETKSDLLRKKTAEVTKACEKHYALEQELAFYKIDHKFDALSRPPLLDTPDGSVISDETGSLPGESPYIGKGRFRRNEHAQESRRLDAQPIVIRHGNIEGPGGHSFTVSDVHVRDRKGYAVDGMMGTTGESSELKDDRKHLEKQLEVQLEQKMKDLEMADLRLQEQRDEMRRNEERLTEVSRELEELMTGKLMQKKMTSRQHGDLVSQDVVRKTSTLRSLRSDAERLDAELQSSRQEIANEQRNLELLTTHLKQLSPRDPQYNEVRRQMAKCERNLADEKDRCHSLDAELQAHLVSMADRAEQLMDAGGSTVPVEVDRELKQELETTVSGLKSYLSEVREKVNTQNEQFATLVRERAQMMQRLREMEPLGQLAQQQQQELNRLHEQLSVLEESMQEARGVNESLRQQLDVSIRRDEGERNVSKLLGAEDEIRRLQHEMKELQKQREAEKESFARKLDAEMRKLGQLKRRVEDGDAREQEVRDLHRQLSELQGANVRLQDKLYSAEQQRLSKRGEQIPVDPEALKKRLEDITQALRTYRRDPNKADAKVKGHRPREDPSGDPIEAVICELQETVRDEVDKSRAEVEKVVKSKEKLEKTVSALKDEIVQVQQQEREMADRAVQAVYENEKHEADAMRDEIRRLEAELKRSHARSTDHHHEHRTRDASVDRSSATYSSSRSGSRSGSLTRSGQGSSSSTVTSATSSQWSQRKRELVNSMTEEERELFTELQDEINNLRRMLANRDASAGPKIEDARRKTQELKTVIDRRQTATVSEHSASSSTISSSTEYPSVPGPHAEELNRVKAEIESLKKQLKNKMANRGIDGSGNFESRTRPERYHSQDHSADSVEQENEVVEQLHAVVDEQLREIDRLQSALNDLGQHQRDDTRTSRWGDREPRPVNSHNGPQRSVGFEPDPRYHQDMQAAGDGGRDPRMRNNGNNGNGPDIPNVRDMPVGHPWKSDNFTSGNGDHIGHDIGVPGAFSQYPNTFPHSDYPAPFPDVPYPVPNFQNSQMTPGLFSQSVPGFPQGYLRTPAAGISSSQSLPVLSHAFLPQSAPSAFLYPSTQPPPVTHPTVYGSGPIVYQEPEVDRRMQAGPLTVPGQVYILPSTTTATASAVHGAQLGGVPPTTAAVAPASEVVADDHQLICNISEHHELEDYLTKLQRKIRKLQAQQNNDESQSDIDVSRHHHQVALDDSSHKLNWRAIKRLQSELEERRAELEALDLAVEHQKEFLSRVDHEERELLERRIAVADELELLRGGSGSGMVQDSRSYHPTVSRRPCTCSDHDTTRVGSAKTDLLAELNCMEQTIIKRRAELNGIEELIVEREAVLAASEAQLAEVTLNREKISAESLEVEQQASEAGSTALALTAEISQLHAELNSMLNQKSQLGKILADIGDVITAKDAEFQEVTGKIQKATERLETLEGTAETRRQRRVSFHGDDAVDKHREELDALLQQIDNERDSLRRVLSDSDSAQLELQMLLEAIEKRRRLLDSLDLKLDSDIAARRRDIEVSSKETEDLSTEKSRLEVEISRSEGRLTELRAEERKREENVRKLKSDLTDCRLRLDDVENQLRLRRSELSDVESESRIQNSSAQRELENLRAESQQLSSELEKTRSQLSSEQKKLENLTEQRKRLGLSIADLEKEKSSLEGVHQELSEQVAELCSEQSAAESAVRDRQRTLKEVETELNRVDAALKFSYREQEQLSQRRDELSSQVERLASKSAEMKQVLRDLTLELGQASSTLTEHRSELNWVTSQSVAKQIELTQIQEDIDNAKTNQTAVISLEQRAQDLGVELERRSSEIGRLTAELNVTRHELEQQRVGMSKENAGLLEQIRSLTVKLSKLEEKLAHRTADLEQLTMDKLAIESTAHSHLARANRLADEMCYLRAINMELKRRLDTQEEIAERETNISETLTRLKQDLKYEVAENVRELETSRHLTTELVELQTNNDSLRQCVDNLRENIGMIKDSSQDVSIPSTAPAGNSKDFFTDHQELLKAQLRQRMQRHVDTMNSQKLLSQDTIHSLRRKLTNLEQVLSLTDSAKLAQLVATKNILPSASGSSIPETPSTDNSLTNGIS